MRGRPDVVGLRRTARIVLPVPRSCPMLVLVLILATSAVGREAAEGDLTFVSPESAVAGAPLRVVAVSDHPRDGALTLVAPDGTELAQTRDRRGGPPYWWYLESTARV